jgi:hypothetical protein
VGSRPVTPRQKTGSAVFKISARNGAIGYLLVAVGDHDGGPGAGGFAIALLPRLACSPFCAPDVIINLLSFVAQKNRTTTGAGDNQNEV